MFSRYKHEGMVWFSLKKRIIEMATKYRIEKREEYLIKTVSTQRKLIKRECNGWNFFFDLKYIDKRRNTKHNGLEIELILTVISHNRNVIILIG